MPRYRITLSDGRIVTLEAPTEPTEADVLEALAFQDAGGEAASGPKASGEASAQPSPSVRGFARNVGTSGKKFGSDLAAAVLSPVETATGMLDLATGLVQKLVPASGRTPALQQREAVADALGQYLTERYGSIDAVKDTAYTDPVGLLSDVSTVLTAGGSAAVKAGSVLKMTRLGRQVERIGTAARTAGDVTNPLTVPLRYGLRPALEATGTGIVEASVRPPAAVKKQQRRPFETSRSIREEHIMSAEGAAQRERDAANAATAAAQAVIQQHPIGPTPTLVRGPMMDSVLTEAGIEQARKRPGFIPESESAAVESLARLERDTPPLLDPVDALERRRMADRLSNEFYRNEQSLLPGSPTSMEGNIQAAWGSQLREGLSKLSPEIARQSDRTRRMMLAEAAMRTAGDRPHALTRMLSLGAAGMGSPGTAAAMMALDAPSVGTFTAAILDEIAKIAGHAETRAVLGQGRAAQAAGVTSPRR